jgi:hypothetical protein
MVHDHRARLVVDLRIHFGVTDEVDDPLFAFRIGQTKPRRKIPATSLVGGEWRHRTCRHSLDINSLVNLAVALRYQMSGRLDESISAAGKEEIHSQHLLRFQQLSLCLLKVKVHI